MLNVVHGIGSIAGAALVSHGDIDCISFIGLMLMVRSIGWVAVEILILVSFELGGKSLFVVLVDVDLDVVV